MKKLIEAVVRDAVKLTIVRHWHDFEEDTDMTEDHMAQDIVAAIMGYDVCEEGPMQSVKDLVHATVSPSIEELIAKWREGIVKLKAGVEDSPSYDLKRMIKERVEAFTICADELEAALVDSDPKNDSYAETDKPMSGR